MKNKNEYKKEKKKRLNFYRDYDIVSHKFEVLDRIRNHTFTERKFNVSEKPTKKGVFGGLTKRELLFDIGYSSIDHCDEKKKEFEKELKIILRQLKVEGKIFYQNGKYYSTVVIHSHEINEDEKRIVLDFMKKLSF